MQMRASLLKIYHTEETETTKMRATVAGWCAEHKMAFKESYTKVISMIF